MRDHLTSSPVSSCVIHGTFMEISSLGVLITGPCGVGKGETALELIGRGHRLIADDAPVFSLITQGTVNGACQKLSRNFLEVRGLGIVNARKLFGKSAIKASKNLELIINLKPTDQACFLRLDRLHSNYCSREILNQEIPEITIPVAPGRNLVILVECAARNHILRTNGYNAAEDFIKKQAHLIGRKQQHD